MHIMLTVLKKINNFSLCLRDFYNPIFKCKIKMVPKLFVLNYILYYYI